MLLALRRAMCTSEHSSARRRAHSERACGKALHDATMSNKRHREGDTESELEARQVSARRALEFYENPQKFQRFFYLEMRKVNIESYS
jgi:hypothetical protein